MYGRYGGDQLNVFLIIFALVISIASNFLTKLGPWPYYVCVGVSWAILIFALYRMFSKQIYKRQRENARYLKVWYPVKNFFIRLFKKRPDAATHKHSLLALPALLSHCHTAIHNQPDLAAPESRC